MRRGSGNRNPRERLIRTMKRALVFLAPLALAACATTPAPGPDADGISWAKLDQRTYVDGPYVTPLEVLEDSRCPINARCIWAGRVRLSVKIDLGSRSEIREITTEKAIDVADGALSLAAVEPGQMAGTTTDPKDYRFGFQFAGGI
jgi:hypothetical protein